MYLCDVMEVHGPGAPKHSGQSTPHTLIEMRLQRQPRILLFKLPGFSSITSSAVVNFIFQTRDLNIARREIDTHLLKLQRYIGIA